MATQEIRALVCNAGPFEWEDRHPRLKVLANPLLEDVFATSVESLLAYEEVDDALSAIVGALEDERYSATAKKELRLLKRAVAWRGCHLANEEIGHLLRQDVVSDLVLGFGHSRKKGQRSLSLALAEHPAQQTRDRYLLLIQE